MYNTVPVPGLVTFLSRFRWPERSSGLDFLKCFQVGSASLSAFVLLAFFSILN